MISTKILRFGSKTMSKLTSTCNRITDKKPQNAANGVVRFIGEMKRKKGIFFGIELDKAKQGDNNGSLGGIGYFKKMDKRGIFIKKS